MTLIKYLFVSAFPRNEVYNLEKDPALYPTLVVLAALSVLLDPAYTLPKKG